jgi:hypothetical protein
MLVEAREAYREALHTRSFAGGENESPDASRLDVTACHLDLSLVNSCFDASIVRLSVAWHFPLFLGKPRLGIDT